MPEDQNLSDSPSVEPTPSASVAPMPAAPIRDVQPPTRTPETDDWTLKTRIRPKVETPE